MPSKALTQWLSSSVQGELELLEAVERRVGEASLTLQRLEETTWGVTLQDFENGRFVVLLLGTDIQTQRWSVGGRPAVRLSSE